MPATNNRCVLVSFVAALTIAVGPALAVGVYDGFEDGDWTANPAWVDGDAGYGIDGGIVADPVRSGNLAWKAMSSDAWCKLWMKDFTPIPWSGFIASVEFLPTTSQYSAGLDVEDVYDCSPGNPREEGFVLRVDYDPSRWPQALFELSQNRIPYGGLPEYHQTYKTFFDGSLMPANEWTRIRLWHDASAGLIRGDIRKVSDNSLIVELSFTPISVGGSKPLADLGIAVRFPSWQYMDNATLTPEPASLSLLAFGGLPLMWRRRQQS